MARDEDGGEVRTPKSVFARDRPRSRASVSLPLPAVPSSTTDRDDEDEELDLTSPTFALSPERPLTGWFAPSVPSSHPQEKSQNLQESGADDTVDAETVSAGICVALLTLLEGAGQTGVWSGKTDLWAAVRALSQSAIGLKLFEGLSIYLRTSYLLPCAVVRRLGVQKKSPRTNTM